MSTPQPSELVIILCMFPSADAAGDAAQTLVGEQLCACVNIVREVRSIYRWQDEVVSTSEVLCLLKTQRARQPALLVRLAELHPYDVPEVVTLSPSDVNLPYLRWVLDETIPGSGSDRPGSP
jgi:periplasmic divalent cation tolerance protein